MTNYDNNAFIDDSGTGSSQPPYERFDDSGVSTSENPNENPTSKAGSSPDTVPWKKIIVTNILISLLIAGIVAMATGLILKSILDKDIENLRTSMEMEFLNAYTKINNIYVLEEQINNMNVDELRTRLSAVENMVQTLLVNISNTEDALDNKIDEVANNSSEGLALLLEKTECLACKVDTPKMSIENYTFSVQENSPEMTYVGTVAAGLCALCAVVLQYLGSLKYNNTKEGDSQTFSYSITEGQFKINSTTGEISTAGRLDREDNPVLMFYVSATYTCSSITKTSPTSTVYVYVTDVNEYPPKFTQPEYSFGAKLNMLIGELLGVITANDVDGGENGKVYYSVTPNDTFNITETTGQVYLVKTLNATIPFYQLFVTARDGGSPSMSATAMVGVELEF